MLNNAKVLSVPREAEQRRTSVDEALYAALLAGSSYSTAGELAGVSARTVRRRTTDPMFRSELARRRSLQTLELSGQIASLHRRAVDALSSSLDDESRAVRLRAAIAILNTGSRLRTEVKVEERMAATEALVDQLLSSEVLADDEEDDDDQA